MTAEDIQEMKAKNGTVPYEEFEHCGKKCVSIRATDGYGIATNYVIENKCPKCGSKFVKIGEYSGCFDGEYTSVDNFTCENECVLLYKDVRPE
jgi:rRNA maturation protein Nop10